METVKAPGLKWRKLAGGRSPIWVADEVDVKNGYQPKTVNLSYIAGDPEMLVAKCNALQTDMLLWRTGYRRDPLKFDGTIRSLLTIYETHPRSSYKALKPGSRKPYNHYIRRMKGHIGPVRIADVSGIDILEWHDVWSENGRFLAAAAMARAVLESALSFGIMLRLDGCVDMVTILRETRRKLPSPRARTEVMTAEQVTRARAAAHKAGRPSAALAYALAFETTLRLWDVIGQWWPMDEPGVSDVVSAEHEEKWFGLRWDNISDDLLLTFTPPKTETRTGKSVAYWLSKAPMVMEELQHYAMERRRGPVIVSETTGLPFREQVFAYNWKADRKAAGIPESVWARDLRASGITEGRATDVSTDDAAKVAGHSPKTARKVYDRAVLEAADRFADARVKSRERSGNDGGNAR